MRRFDTAALAIILVSLATTAVAATKKPEPPPLPPPMSRVLYAPLLRSAELPDGELTLNNRAPHPMTVTLRLHDTSGNSYQFGTVTLDPGEVRRYSVAELLPNQWKNRKDLGGLSASYTGQWNEVATQLTLFGSPGAMDERLSLVSDFKSQVLDGVWYMPEGGHARIAIGNSSGQPATITITHSAGKTDTISVPPFGTSFVDYENTANGSGAQAQSVRVQSSAAGGLVQAVGYVTFPKGGTRTVRFYDSAVMRSADLFATSVPIANRQVQLVLKNVGSDTIMARPVFRSSKSGMPFLDIQPVQLAAGEAQIDTSALMSRAASDPDFHAASLQVTNTGGANGSLIGSLAAYDAQSHVSYELPLRDSGTLKTSGGSYLIRLDADYQTTVSITNVTNDIAEFTAGIRHNSGNYSLPRRSLAPGETALYDIGRIRDDQTADVNGATLPADLRNAQFNWSMANGGATPKLIGRSHMVSASKGVSASFSCPICCPDSGLYKYFSGWSPIIVNFTQNQTITASNVSCYNQTTWSGPDYPDWSDSNSSVAYATTNVAHGVAPGSTSSTTYWTFYWYETDGMDCFPRTTDTNEQEPETVKATISGDHVVWFFNGYSPSGYATQITLTASAGSYHTWQVISGSISLTDNGATATITGTNKTSLNGASVRVIVDGQESDNFYITVKVPDHLAYTGTDHVSDGIFFYKSTVHYRIEDQFGDVLPHGVDFNEHFTSGQIADYSGMNWERGPEQPTANADPTDVYDQIQGQRAFHIPPATIPCTPLCSTKVVHWTGGFWVGSTYAGAGYQAMSLTWQKYTDHAAHE